MRSVRLDPDLDERVRRAAAAEGTSVSQFIRRAVHDRVERTLHERPSDVLADVIGSVHGGGGRAERTGEAFAHLLADRRSREWS